MRAALLAAATALIARLDDMAIHPSHYAELRGVITDLRSATIEAENNPPKTVVVIKSNCAPVINEVFASAPGVKVIFLDEDIEGCDPDTTGHVDGDLAWVGVFDAQHNTPRVAGVCIEAAQAGFGKGEAE